MNSDTLREAIRTFRDPNTSDDVRRQIAEQWAAQGIPNHVAASLRLAVIDIESGEVS